jgi:hypothetical protein
VRPQIAGYPLMAESRSEMELGSDFLWLADVQKNKQENLYVDEVHYTALFNKEIATVPQGQDRG